MRLGDLCAGLVEVGAAGELPVSGLTADSRAVTPGMLFVALPFVDRPGFKHDGHAFIAAARDNGAAAILATDAARAEAAAGGLPVLIGADTRWLLPRLAARWHGDASQRLRLVGLTGTNGKTTTSYLCDAVMRAAGWRTVLVGTVETRLDQQVRPAATTTPDPLTLQALWREAVAAGVTGGCMEVSSHALDQHRTDATRYEVAVFTNLTQDHLDYHQDLESYFQAKQRLFAPDEQGWQPLAVVNHDDAAGRRLLAGEAREPVSFGLGPGADVQASEVRFDLTGASFTVDSPWGRWEQRTRLAGDYNVANALAAATVCLRLGLPLETVAAALADAAGAPGRLERVDEGQPFLVLVDYGHTPDAVSNALAAVRRLGERQVISVLGCGGDRDRTKRPLMARAAAEVSDVVVITSDNPRTEDPAAIIADMLTGIDDTVAARVVVEGDRRVGIGRALELAGDGDIVVILGKGHEQYLQIGERKVHFDDREVAREWLQSHR